MQLMLVYPRLYCLRCNYSFDVIVMPLAISRQVSEAQRELQLVTDSMVSKMSTETGHSTDVNKSEAAPQVDNGGGMDDLFRYILT